MLGSQFLNVFELSLQSDIEIANIVLGMLERDFCRESFDAVVQSTDESSGRLFKILATSLQERSISNSN